MSLASGLWLDRGELEGTITRFEESQKFFGRLDFGTSVEHPGFSLTLRFPYAIGIYTEISRHLLLRFGMWSNEYLYEFLALRYTLSSPFSAANRSRTLYPFPQSTLSAQAAAPLA